MQNDYITWFLPPFVKTLMSLIKGCIGYYQCRKFSFLRREKEIKDVIIIGNGPSLKESLENEIDMIVSHDCLAVNQFVCSDFFERIRPSYYLIADPAYFKEQESNERLYNLMQELENGLKRVTWYMTLIIPIDALGSQLIERLRYNRYLTISCYNCKGNPTFIPNSKVEFFLWNHNLLAPLGMTVINTAISLMISRKVNNIYVIGADTSWHENYELDQQTNMLYSNDKHFYGSRRIPIYENEELKIPAKIHNELRYASIALESYWKLAEYASYNKVNVFNSSTYSWIDAFPRETLRRSFL